MLDWEKIWERYDDLDQAWTGDPAEAPDFMWQAIDEQVLLADAQKIQIDQMWDEIFEEFIGEEPVDGKSYDLPEKFRIELQGILEGAVELSLRTSGWISGPEIGLRL